jgi:alcohol dehydrogenase class IV
MNQYELGRVPRILVGQESIQGLHAMLRGWECSSTVLIVDQVVSSTGYTAKIKEALKGFAILEHIVPPGEPTVKSINAAALTARSAPRPTVIGVGGGSALDTAKQVAVVAASFEGVEHYLLRANPFQGRRRIIAIPTTAGTGAEVTRTCVLSDDDGRKLWTWGDEMLPDVVILDPSVTITLPASVTAATGLDAFVHGLEANTGQRHNAISSASALQAMRLVQTHLPTAVNEPGNLEARGGMQEAALLAGLAIDNCGTGIAHCIGHALGALYHVPHGVAVTIGLEAALAWNLEGAEAAYADAAAVFGVSPRDLPAAFKTLLEAARFADAARALPDAALDANAISETMIAIENQPMVHNNARAVGDADRLELAQRTVEVWNAYRSEKGA